MNKAQRDIRRKKRVLEHAARVGNVRKTCRYVGVAAHFLEAGIAVSIERSNVLENDVWKAHSGDVPMGVGVVSTSDLVPGTE